MRLMVVGELGEQLVAAIQIAKASGAKVSHVPDIDSCRVALCSGKGANLLMVDVKLDIRKLHAELTRERISIPIVGYGIGSGKEAAVKAIHNGAQEYMPLPPDREVMAAIFEMLASGTENQDVIYKSASFKKVMEIAKKVANSNASILITGPSGTGKEVMARFIYTNSDRKMGEFISINCAAIPDNLLESELFGHEKGAFTGAMERKIGKFEQAHKGTLLLDEISEMDIRLQAKLLRAIQEREIIRVGGSKPINLDIRIIATSNRNLVREVKKGNFREDLFFRLNVINLALPPLKERVEDIDLLAKYFIDKYAGSNGIEPKSLSKQAILKLKGHSWPGNIRELENVMHRAILLSQGTYIDADDIQILEEYYDTLSPQVSTLSDIEKEAIRKALIVCDGNHNKMAAVLGITIKQLKEKLSTHRML